jgi:type VI secretion system protein ImpJ
MSERDLDSVPPAIQWHEGMLLTPQHFQQASLRQEALLAYQLNQASAYPWGVVRCTIDRARLVNGLFRIEDLEAILPDGTSVRHPAPGAKPLELDLVGLAEQFKKGPQRISVVTPARMEGSRNDGQLRYRSFEDAPIVDENTGIGEVRIPRLAPNLSLLASNDPPGRYVALPVAEIAYRNENFELTNYQAPCPALTAETQLGLETLDMVKRVREKAVYLADTAKMVGNAGSTASLETRWMVHSLVAPLPPLEALLYSGVAHPLPLYLALTALTGSFTALGASTFPPTLPPYDHSDLRGTYQRALDFINLCLDKVQPDYISLPFEATEGGFRIMLKPGWVKRRLVVGAKIREGMGEQATMTWIMNSQIGSSGRLEGFLERRILGAPRRPIEQQDAMGLQSSRGMALFTIDALPDVVEANQFLEVVNLGRKDDPARPEALFLYIRTEKKKAAAE